MWIETLGFICVAWTAFEVAWLALGARQTRRFRRRDTRHFGAFDTRGEAIDVEYVD